MKVMVCLISDQHVPNLLSVHAVEPDLLFLVETPGMKAKRGASNFIRALRMGSSKKPKCRIITLEPTSRTSPFRSSIFHILGQRALLFSFARHRY
ncbi:MAG: DUF1887 family protein [Methanotrichaceae archaeon]|nr:DUF1887 family protein [Methanotrichaceae archaeon]